MPITLKPVVTYKAESLSGMTPTDLIGLTMMEFGTRPEVMTTAAIILHNWIFKFDKYEGNPSVMMYSADEHPSTYIEAWLSEDKYTLNLHVFCDSYIVCETSIPVEELDFIEYDD